MKPTLALCIPAFNAAWCLPRLLEEARSQTVPFDEILVYDDCSTDETAAVVREHGATVLSGDSNQGCSFGKNQLALAAKSDWLHFHDADDSILPHFVETVHRRLVPAADAVDVLLLNYEYRDHATGALIHRADYDASLMRRDPFEFVLRYKVVNFGVYRRSSFLDCGGFDLDPEVLYNEDAAFHYRLAQAGLTFGYEPEVTCINYRYGASMSASSQVRCIEAQFHVLKKASEKAESRYHPLIAQKLWSVAGVAGSYLAWDVADRAARLAASLGGRYPRTRDGHLFRVVASLHPGLALRVRETVIRRLRPGLRRGAPFHASAPA